MQKKKLLLIMSNLAEGGVSRSFVSFTNSIDYNKFDVDVFLLDKRGIHADKLPKEANIIHFDFLHDVWDLNMLALIRKGKIKAIVLRFIQILFSKIDKGVAAWFLSKALPRIKKNYDVAFDYCGQHMLYYMIDRVSAKKKISYFHNDYSKWSYYYSVDKRYYPFADAILSISDTCVESLKKYFPNLKSKCIKLENIIPLEEIENKAKCEVNFESQFPTILTLGHLCERKGTSLALGAAKLLKERGIQFHWYFIGKVSYDDRIDYNQLKSESDLDTFVTFLGLKENPYPYIKQCDIFALPSKFEGKSIALDEAKAFLKPIVVTNFSTVLDQFTHRQNATICNMDPESLSSSIEELLVNKSLRLKYMNSLKIEQIETINSMEKFEQLVL